MESVSLVRADRMEPAAAAASAARSSTLPLQPKAAAGAPAKKDSGEKLSSDEEIGGGGVAKKRTDKVEKSSEKSSEKSEGAVATSPVPAARKRGKPEAASPLPGPAGKKISAERLEEAPPIACTHLKSSKEKVEGERKSKFDFALVSRKSRVAQLTALTVQMYVIHSEWDRIGNFHFVLLFVALLSHGINTFMRWRDSIDGRFDLTQIFLCTSNNLRVQYALAVLSGPLLALFTYWFLIPQKISLVNATLYSIAAIIKMIFAVGCFILEAMEVSRDTLKPHWDYAKSYFA